MGPIRSYAVYNGYICKPKEDPHAPKKIGGNTYFIPKLVSKPKVKINKVKTVAENLKGMDSTLKKYFLRDKEISDEMWENLAVLYEESHEYSHVYDMLETIYLAVNDNDEEKAILKTEQNACISQVQLFYAIRKAGGLSKFIELRDSKYPLDKTIFNEESEYNEKIYNFYKEYLYKPQSSQAKKLNYNKKEDSDIINTVKKLHGDAIIEGTNIKYKDNYSEKNMTSRDNFKDLTVDKNIGSCEDDE